MAIYIYIHNNVATNVGWLLRKSWVINKDEGAVHYPMDHQAAKSEIGWELDKDITCLVKIP
jgi:hypothetical protein